MPGAGQHLVPAEKSIWEVLILALFDCNLTDFSDEFCQLLSHGAKQGGINLRKLTVGVECLHQASSEESEILMTSLLRNIILDSVGHKACVCKAGAKARQERLGDE